MSQHKGGSELAFLTFHHSCAQAAVKCARENMQLYHLDEGDFAWEFAPGCHVFRQPPTSPYRSVIFWDPETKALEMPVNIG